MRQKITLVNALVPLLLALVLGCNNTEPENKTTAIPVDTIKKAPVVVKEEPVETRRGPVINIGDTLSIKRMVLVMKDSAASFDRIAPKLADIYGAKLGAIMKKNNVKMTGSPMAWYKTEKAPYFFEAGIPVDKKPAKLSGGAYIKEIGVDSIVVAHFYGPYDLLPQAYDALKDWLKDHKKKQKGAPYEIYVGDPMDVDGKMKDPYKVQTDVVFPWK